MTDREAIVAELKRRAMTCSALAQWRKVGGGGMKPRYPAMELLARELMSIANGIDVGLFGNVEREDELAATAADTLAETKTQ